MNRNEEGFFQPGNVCFIKSSLGIRVKVLREGWKLISQVKHPDLAGKFKQVLVALQKPDVILQDREDTDLFFYHKRVTRGKFLRVVVRHYARQEGFLITAHYIKKPKGGKLFKEYED